MRKMLHHCSHYLNGNSIGGFPGSLTVWAIRS